MIAIMTSQTRILITEIGRWLLRVLGFNRRARCFEFDHYSLLGQLAKIEAIEKRKRKEREEKCQQISNQ